jgi:hypothetical protein
MYNETLKNEFAGIRIDRRTSPINCIFSRAYENSSRNYTQQRV